MKTRSNAAVRSGLVVIVTLAAAAGCGGGAPDLAVSAQAEKEGKGESEHERNERPNFEIRTLSNRADLISDGDALVEVQVPRNVQTRKVTLTLNGANVDASFADAGNGTLRGVVTGLRVGKNLFVADANGRGEGRPFATLTITNHPRGGPVLLGSQTQPWVCATQKSAHAVR